MLVTVISDTSGIRPPEIIETDLSIIDWLIGYYGKDGPDFPIRLFDGEISESSEISLGSFNDLDRVLTGNLYVVHNPLGLDPVTIQVIASVVIALTVVALMPTPRIPDESKDSKTSPNNSLSGQTNIARTLERIPDIFGKVLSYPDLINPTSFEYINNVKVQDEYLCITRGYALVENFKNGNTLIDNIAGSSVEIFQPGELPGDVPKTNTSPEVDGQELVAPNGGDVGVDGSYVCTYDALSDEATIITPNNGEWFDILPGGTVTLYDPVASSAAGGTNTFEIGILSVVSANVYGVYTVLSVDDTSLVLQDASLVSSGWTTPSLSFPAPVITTSAVDGSSTAPQVQIGNVLRTVGPFNVPGSDYSEIWLDVIAPIGLASGASLSGPKVVDIEFFVEEIDSNGDPTGTSFTYPFVASGSDRRPRFWTAKLTSSEGIIKGNNYRVSATRISDKNANRAESERVTWDRLASIEFVDRTDEPGTTRARIITRATEQVASISDRKFNCEATRKVVTYENGVVVGNILTGVGLQASRRFSDALLHYFIDPALGAGNVANLDVDALYEIQDQLDSVFNGEKGEFSFTFDGQNTPALEEMRIIANSCRCFLSRKGSFFTVTRDQIQNVSKGLFNRRNKKPFSESRSIRFNKPLDNDGVILEYSDITDNEPKTIRLPQNLESGDPNYGLSTPFNPKKVEGAGIRNYSQAWDRAQYELNKIIHQRVTVESTCGAEAGILPLNARVSHVDGTRLSKLSSDGEVTGVNGLIVTTSERCVFEDGKTYSVIFRDDIGGPISPIVVTQRSDSDFGFNLSSAPPFTLLVRGDNEYQRGTLYNFGPDGDEEQDHYLLQRLTPNDEFYYTMELINYTEAYYQADNQIPPEQ